MPATTKNKIKHSLQSSSPCRTTNRTTMTTKKTSSLLLSCRGSSSDSMAPSAANTKLNQLLTLCKKSTLLWSVGPSLPHPHLSFARRPDYLNCEICTSQIFIIIWIIYQSNSLWMIDTSIPTVTWPVLMVGPGATDGIKIAWKLLCFLYEPQRFIY